MGGWLPEGRKSDGGKKKNNSKFCAEIPLKTLGNFWWRRAAGRLIGKQRFQKLQVFGKCWRSHLNTTERLHFHFTYLIGKLILKGHFPGGSDGKKAACNEGVPGLIPGLGRSSGEGNGNPLQFSCLENSMDRGGYSPWCCNESDMTEHVTHILKEIST